MTRHHTSYGMTPDDQVEELFSHRALRLMLIIGAATYTSGSLVFSAIEHFPGLARVLQRLPATGAWALVVGPLALPAAGREALAAYGVATALLAGCAFGTLRSLQRLSGWCMFYGALGLLTWVTCGLLLLAAAI